MLTRYRDVKAALLSPAKFSSAAGYEILQRAKDIPDDLRKDFDVCYRFWYTTLQANDAPKHTQQRHPLIKAFTPSLIAKMRGAITERVDELLESLLKAGKADFVAEFAYPLPSRVIFDLLGLPAEDHQTIREAAAALVKFPPAALRGSFSVLKPIAASLRKADVVLKALVEERRAKPGGDLISTLVHESDPEAHMSDDEIVVLCNFLLMAGHETTANLIAGSMRYLLSDRKLWSQLRDQPELLENAVEELLRFVSPLVWLPRVMTEEVELDGHILRKGERVQLSIGAANHDPEEFADPESIILTRPKPRSLAFGYGAHFCVGAALARLETQIALSSLLKRTPNIILESKTFEYQPIHFLRALKELHVSV
jgi:cytochrome P450